MRWFKMMKTEKLQEVVLECYRELFKAAAPKGNFDKMMTSGEAKTPRFFMRYYLAEEKQQKIMEAVCKKHKLKPFEQRKVIGECALGCSPTVSKEAWEKERKA
jgi:hypothetical protein